MPKGTTLEVDDKYIFVYACFKSASKNGGKVDFDFVATTLNITVNAARKRLGALNKSMDAAGIATGGPSVASATKKAGTGEIEGGGADAQTPKIPKRKAKVEKASKGAPRAKKAKVYKDETAQDKEELANEDSETEKEEGLEEMIFEPKVKDEETV